MVAASSYIVPPSQIQEELDALWNAQDNKNKIKASLFNIIFFTKKSPREEYIRKIAFNLVEKFPARIFFVSSTPESQESSLKTAISVISTEQGEFNITCDLIEISAQGQGEKQIPFILLPHIVPDLPVFLVWAEEPTFENSLCNALKKMATRMIFDSESTEDLCRFSQAVAAVQTEMGCEIADLNWARLESWRDILMSAFSTSEKIDDLQKTSSLILTYNAQETPFFCHTKIQAIYLQAWIATRMNWTADKKHFALDLSRFLYNFQGQPIEVELKAVKETTLPPGMILSLEIQTRNGGHYLFSRDPRLSQQVSLIYSTPQECKLPVHFLTSKGESGQSLIKEICHKGTSSHYQGVLEAIAKWNRGLLC